jgi:hypothetical protein
MKRLTDEEARILVTAVDYEYNAHETEIAKQLACRGLFSMEAIRRNNEEWIVHRITHLGLIALMCYRATSLTQQC